MTATTTEDTTEDATLLQVRVIEALDTVLDPELDEPVTDLGFVRSVAIDEAGVEVHLRLPTSFCAPNFAYLMVSDAEDALRRVPGIGTIRVLLDDHHDSDKINAGTAAGAGYRGTFGVEADQDLDELRTTFQRKAHLAAMERCCQVMLKRGTWTLEELPELRLQDLPDSEKKQALLRRRATIGLPVRGDSLVMVDHDGTPVTREQSALFLRLAMSTRISIEGNSHFCRGLLATRYSDSDPDGAANGFAPAITNTRKATA